MIVVMSREATEAQVRGVLDRLRANGLEGHRVKGEESERC